jgi:hypothetical protein
MLGDCQDLNLVFAWARRVFWTVDPADPEQFVEWPYPSEVRRKVAEFMKELAHCFDVSEQAHRKEHRLTGNKAHVKVWLMDRGFRYVLTTISPAKPCRLQRVPRGPSL